MIPMTTWKKPKMEKKTNENTNRRKMWPRKMEIRNGRQIPRHMDESGRKDEKEDWIYHDQ